MDKVKDIRKQFAKKLKNEEFVIDKSGVKTIEIVGATFIADEDTIYGTVNEDWNEREKQWYLSMSRNVNDIPPPIPVIWKQVASSKGIINSNYGWCIYSSENYSQYLNVLDELKRNPDTRRASMIYTRPSMHYDYNVDGMSDFICTWGVQYFIREKKLHAHVLMRSNDAVFGYKGDRAWQKYVQESLANDLGVEVGDLIWTASSLHVYERHFELVK